MAKVILQLQVKPETKARLNFFHQENICSEESWQKSVEIIIEAGLDEYDMVGWDALTDKDKETYYK